MRIAAKKRQNNETVADILLKKKQEYDMKI